MAAAALTAAVTLRRGEGARVGAERVALLQAVGELGSIRAAAERLGLSYKGAWDAVQALNNLFDQPLVTAHAGGKQGGETVLTPRGHALIAAFQRVEDELARTLDRFDQGDDFRSLFWSLGMRTSARNALRGVVAHVTDGAVNAEVTVQVGDTARIVAVVTRASVDDLGLAIGKPAIALIKSSFILLAKGEGLMTSARNQVPGRVAAREDGAINSEISLEIAEGKTLTATITRESAAQLDLKPGDAVTALIKASHVILAVE
jgi:molybdate transport system regulatory protein